MMAIIGPALHWVVFALVVTIGLRTRLQDMAWVFQEPSRAGKAFAALFVVVPGIGLAICSGFGLAGGVALLLIILSAAPLAPLYPNDMQKRGVRDAAAIGLGAFAAILSILITPAMLWLVANVVRADIDVVPGAMLAPLLEDMLLPLVVGMVAAELAPRHASKAAAIIVKFTTPLMLALIVLLLWETRALILARLDLRTVVACALLAAAALGVGHLFGGPTATNRTGLAMASAGRNISFAIAVSKSVLPAETAAVAGTAILYSLIRPIMVSGYTRLTQDIGRDPAAD